jgi:predicted amidohydrolase YtcJ
VAHANTIFHNGVLWTGLLGRAGDTALAVSGDRISAVGLDDDVLNLRVDEPGQ